MLRGKKKKKLFCFSGIFVLHLQCFGSKEAFSPDNLGQGVSVFVQSLGNTQSSSCQKEEGATTPGFL